jgi:hypothetical protein
MWKYTRGCAYSNRLLFPAVRRVGGGKCRPLNAEAKQQILAPMLVELACLSEIDYYIQFSLRLLDIVQ